MEGEHGKTKLILLQPFEADREAGQPHRFSRHFFLMSVMPSWELVV
jgi:hypothetical protein